MHNKTWKKECDLLSEAYQSITETTHDSDGPALGPDEERQEDGSVKNTKTGKIVYTPKNKENVDEMGEFAGDEAMIDRTPDEVDAEIDSLKSLILNPPVDKIEEYARNGQLHVYVDMLKAKLDAAEKVKAAVRGDVE